MAAYFTFAVRQIFHKSASADLFHIGRRPIFHLHLAIDMRSIEAYYFKQNQHIRRENRWNGYMLRKSKNILMK